MLILRPKYGPCGQTSVNDVRLVLCIALEVSILSSKLRSGINNLCLLTSHTYRTPFGNYLVLKLKVPSI